MKRPIETYDPSVPIEKIASRIAARDRIATEQKEARIAEMEQANKEFHASDQGELVRRLDILEEKLDLIIALLEEQDVEEG